MKKSFGTIIHKLKILGILIIIVSVLYAVLFLVGIPPFVVIREKVYCTYVNKFTIVSYQENDCKNLKYFRNLKELNFNGDEKTSVEFLASMTRLERLYLLDISFEEINKTVLSKNLKELVIFNADVQELSFLKNNEELSKLYIENAYTVKPHDYEDCEKKHYMISSVDGIQSNTKLEYLYLPVCSDTDLSALNTLKSLKSLNLNTNNTDLSAVYECESLESFNLSNGKIEKLDGIEKLKKLQDLRLETLYIEDFSCLKKLENLRVLYLYNESGFGDLSFLKDMTCLEEVHIFLSGNNSSIDEFEELQSVLETNGVDVYIEVH